jgi:hypothetical protein
MSEQKQSVVLFDAVDQYYTDEMAERDRAEGRRLLIADAELAAIETED